MTDTQTTPDIPVEAIEAAAKALDRLDDDRHYMDPGGWVIDMDSYREDARTAIEAAAPILMAAAATYTPADVELVAAALWPRSAVLNDPPAAVREADARAVLDALAAAGRLRADAERED